MFFSPSISGPRVLLALLWAGFGWVSTTQSLGAGVGNLVYLDSNNSGGYNAGEGLNGVTVQLYASTATPEVDPPLFETVTANGGQFLFDGLSNGNYFLHVPSTQFVGGAPLESLISMAGVSIGLDDDAGEDGEDAAIPSSSGVRTLEFTLLDGSEPTDGDVETGGFASSDNAQDSNVDLTVDFGFVPSVPASYLAWQTDNPLGGSNLPADNPDGDDKANLMEYALQEPADSAVSSGHEFQVRWDSGNVTGSFVRSWGGHADLNYVIEGTTDEPGPAAVWSELSAITPSIQLAAGEETVTYSGLQTESVFVGATQGFLRLRVELDADGNSVPEATVYSSRWEFASVPLPTRNQTFGMPLATAPIFFGAVDQVNGNALDLTTAVGSGSILGAIESGKSYFVEVTSGDFEGHRWELNEGVSTATSVTLDPAAALSTRSSVPATLVGQTVAIRVYWRINDLFSGTDLVGATSMPAAPRITFYDKVAGRFQALWRFSNGSITRWLRDGDATLSDAGLTSLDVCRGWFINPGAGAAIVRVAGIVRTNLVACDITGGSNLISIPSVVPKAPLDYLMTVDGGMTGSTNQAVADRLRFWRGDTEATEGYTGYWLYKTPSLERWLKDGDANLTDYTQATLFSPFRGFFLLSSNGLIDWKMQALSLTEKESKENGPR